MLRLPLLFLALLLTPLHAALWRNDDFGCMVNLPDSADWQTLSAQEVPGIVGLVAIINPKRTAVFGINVVNSAPSTNLRDPATVKSIETMLRSFGYEFYGSSTVNIGGLEWKQYPVKSSAGGSPMTGVVRYTSGNGKIFGVSMLLGGGKEAVQDLELQATAGSFRLFRPLVAQATPGAAAPADDPAKRALPGAPAESKETGGKSPESAPAEKTIFDQLKTPTGDWDIKKIGIFGGGLLLVLIILIKIIGGGSSGPAKPKR